MASEGPFIPGPTSVFMHLFNGATPALAGVDESGNGHHATVASGTPTYELSGYGKAIKGDDTDEAVQLDAASETLETASGSSSFLGGNLTYEVVFRLGNWITSISQSVGSCANYGAGSRRNWGTEIVAGRGPVYETFTPPTGYFPIYEIRLGAQTNRQYEAGEIWLGPRWDWTKFLYGDWTPNDGEIEVRTITLEGGTDQSSEKYRKRIRRGHIKNMTAAESVLWDAFVEKVGTDKRFWYYHAGSSSFGKAPEVILMKNVIEPRPRTQNVRFDVSYQFKEM